MQISEYRQYISSPITISICIAIGICALGIFLFTKPKEKHTLNIPEEKSIQTTPEIDSDNDGLPDWIELAYHTDPQNADSDQDGTPDQEEIFAGRNPNLPGPNDTFSIISTASEFASSTEADKIQFLEQYLSQEARTTQIETTRNLLKEFNPKEVQDRYSIKDLTIDYSSGTTSVKTYTNTLGAMLQKYRDANIESETTLLKKALDSKKITDLQKIELPAKQYGSMSDELRAMHVPTPLTNAHLTLVNAYDVMGRGLTLTTKLFSDPVIGAGGWQAYFIKSLLLSRAYAEIIVSVKDHSIIFSSDEPGAFFQANVQ